MPTEFSGSGTGLQTPDGCSVEFYCQLPYLSELEDVLPAFPPSSTVLELGCGTGRLCNRLMELGHQVTGVDESPEMLGYVPVAVETIQSSIESLNLPRVWCVVLLPSHLINHPDYLIRKAFLLCARRHLANGGSFFAKRHNIEWLRAVEPGHIGTSSGVEYHVDEVSRKGNVCSMSLRYQAFGKTWRQSFSTLALTEPEIETMLLEAGLSAVRWHGSQRLWVEATAEEV